MAQRSEVGRTACALWAFLWALSVSQIAAAEEQSTNGLEPVRQEEQMLVLALTPGPKVTPQAAAEFSRLLHQELEARGAVFKRSPPSTSAPAAPESKDPWVESRKLLDDFKFAEATVALQKVLAEMWADPPSWDRERIAEGQLLLAVAAFRAGEEKKAQVALFERLRVDPTFSLPEGTYPPVFVRELDKARQKLERAPHAVLSVDGPLGSIAYVDGRSIGPVPATVTGLPVGTHLVRVEGPRGELFAQALNVQGSSAEVRAVYPSRPLTPARPADFGELVMEGTVLDDKLGERVDRLCKEAGAERALLGVVFFGSDDLLAASLALYSREDRGFRVLPPMYFDANLKSANVEAFRLADQLLSRLKEPWATVSVPYPLATTQLLVIPPSPVMGLR